MAERVMTHTVGDGCQPPHAAMLRGWCDWTGPTLAGFKEHVRVTHPQGGTETAILAAIRELPHGHVTVYVQDSEIVRYEVTESVKPRRVGA